MLLSVSDMALLRILRWCQYADRTDILALCPEPDLTHLIGVGLIKIHVGSGGLVLTGKGNVFLAETFGSDLPKEYQTYRPDAIPRRIHLARIMLTAYRAGLSVFLNKLEELSAPPALFLPAVARGRGRNPWGNTRVAAIAALDDLLCDIHWVCPGIGKLLLADELGAFSNNTACLPAQKSAFVFAGDSYQAVLTELDETVQETTERLISYGEAYQRSPIPIHLLACDAVGVQQLQIMSAQHYRAKLTRAALRGQYEPPPEGTDWDAQFDHAPFLLAVDMNLRHIDAICQRQKKRGGKKPVLAALEGQAEAVLYARYRDTALARVFTLTEGALENFSTSPNPTNTPFLTSKGDVVHAPPIQASGATGKGRRKK